MDLVTGSKGSSSQESSTSESSYYSVGYFSSLSPTERQSVLVLGSAGVTGSEIILQLAQVKNAPWIHGMALDSRRIPHDVMNLHRKYTESLIEGDATQAADLYRALWISQANIMIAAIRETSAQDGVARAMVQVLRHPPFRHVRVILISSSTSLPRHKKGRRRPFQHRNRTDSNEPKQEAILALDHTIQSRTTVVYYSAHDQSKDRYRFVKQFHKAVLRNTRGGMLPETVELAEGIVRETLRQAAAQ